MHNLADSSSIAGAKLVHDSEVLGAQVQLKLDTDLEGAEAGVEVVAAVVVVGLGSGRRRSHPWFCLQHEPFDILPLQRLRLEG